MPFEPGPDARALDSALTAWLDAHAFGSPDQLRG
jgi:hypothetical protein